MEVCLLGNRAALLSDEDGEAAPSCIGDRDGAHLSWSSIPSSASTQIGVLPSACFNSSLSLSDLPAENCTVHKFGTSAAERIFDIALLFRWNPRSLPLWLLAISNWIELMYSRICFALLFISEIGIRAEGYRTFAGGDASRAWNEKCSNMDLLMSTCCCGGSLGWGVEVRDVVCSTPHVLLLFRLFVLFRSRALCFGAHHRRTFTRFLWF